MRPVRTISRKDLGEEAPVRPRIEVDLLGILRDYTPGIIQTFLTDVASLNDDDIVRSA